MTHEIPRFVKVAIAAAGAAVTLSGGPLMLSQENNSTPTNTKGTHTEWHIMPCPKDFVPPWEYQAPKNDNGGQQAMVIELASIKKPEPTPSRDRTECWGPVEVPNTQIENTNPTPDTTILVPQAELIPLAHPGQEPATSPKSVILVPMDTTQQS